MLGAQLCICLLERACQKIVSKCVSQWEIVQDWGNLWIEMTTRLKRGISLRCSKQAWASAHARHAIRHRHFNIAVANSFHFALSSHVHRLETRESRCVDSFHPASEQKCISLATISSFLKYVFGSWNWLLVQGKHIHGEILSFKMLGVILYATNS